MTYWKLPPIIKIYEALGAIADDRIKLEDNNTAKVYSSSGNKYYTVSYDPSSKALMCNDNGSFWAGYLGYPAIAYLFKSGLIPINIGLANLLRDIKWKDINQNFKNDFSKTEKYCQDLIVARDGNLTALLSEITKIHNYLKDHPYSHLGKKIKPPTGY